MSAGTWQETQAHLPSELAPHTHTAEFSHSPALSPARSPLKGAREFSPQPRAYSPMHGGETSDSDVPGTSGPRRQSTPQNKAWARKTHMANAAVQRRRRRRKAAPWGRASELSPSTKQPRCAWPHLPGAHRCVQTKVWSELWRDHRDQHAVYFAVQAATACVWSNEYPHCWRCH